MQNNSQELVIVKLTSSDPALTPVTATGTTGYTINYTHFVVLGGDTDNVTVNLNYVTPMKMVAGTTVNVPINYLLISAATTDGALMVFGTKRYNTIGNF